MSLTLQEFNRIQAEKFQKHQRKIDDVKVIEQKLQEEEDHKQAELLMQQEEELRLKEEEEMLKKMQYREEFDNVLDRLDNIIVGIHMATSIMEVGMNTYYLKTLLENNKMYADNVDLLPELAERVMTMISAISENPNTNYDISKKDNNFDASVDITDNIKECLKLVHTDESSINLQLMNTDNDEEYARSLQDQFYSNPFGNFQRNRNMVRRNIRRPIQRANNHPIQQDIPDFFPDMPDIDNLDN